MAHKMRCSDHTTNKTDVPKTFLDRTNWLRETTTLYLENVFEAFKRDGYDLGVVDLKEI